MDQSDFGKERIMGRQGMTRTIMVLVFLAQSLNASHASVHDIRTYSFLYTQNNRDNTRSLFAASIQPTGIRTAQTGSTVLCDVSLDQYPMSLSQYPIWHESLRAVQS